MDIEHISVSRKALWDECHEKYRFKYHEKVPTSDNPIYFSYGKMVHRIAELYVAQGDPNLFGEIVADVVSGRVEIQAGETAPKLDREYSRKLSYHLKTLKTIIDRIGLNQEGFTEYEFRYDLMPPREYFVKGFIDRIIVRGGKYFICDYKTSKKGPWLKNDVTVLGDLQLRTYAKVVQKEFGAAAGDIRCCLVYLDTGDIVGASYSQRAIDAAERELLDAYLEIHGMDPGDARGNVGGHCNRCEFRRMCRFWSLT